MDPNNQLDKYILVTGGAGFIGSNLCEYLVSSGAKVRCLDDFSTGHKSNIERLLGNKDFELLEGDICDIKTCSDAVEGIDYVLHQAALGSVPRSIKNPIKTNEVNISGFLNMLTACKNEGVKRFVYAASSSTYGDSEGLPKIEHTIGNPLSPYAVTKRVNELYAHVFKLCYDFDTIGLRYFNVFGQFQDPEGAYAAVIPKFISQLIKYESPIINGDGSYSRDFTYIKNVIEANVLAILTEDEMALNQIYNVAASKQTTLLELFKLLKDELNQHDSKIGDVEIKLGPTREGDIPHSLASIDKARELLGYDPKYNIDDGLKEAIPWYFNNLN